MYASATISDKRKLRRQHRATARHLRRTGGRGDGPATIGSTVWAVAGWHLAQARALGR